VFLIFGEKKGGRASLPRGEKKESEITCMSRGVLRIRKKKAPVATKGRNFEWRKKAIPKRGGARTTLMTWHCPTLARRPAGKGKFSYIGKRKEIVSRGPGEGKEVGNWLPGEKSASPRGRKKSRGRSSTAPCARKACIRCAERKGDVSQAPMRRQRSSSYEKKREQGIRVPVRQMTFLIGFITPTGLSPLSRKKEKRKLKFRRPAQNLIRAGAPVKLLGSSKKKRIKFPPARGRGGV